MKRVTYKAGQYSSIEVRGSRFFLEALPDSVSLRKMRFKLFPGDIVWQYQFPFFIRTALEGWELSVEIIEIILVYLGKCSSVEELLRCVDDEITPFLEEWGKLNEDRAYKIGIGKLGVHYRTPKRGYSSK